MTAIIGNICWRCAVSHSSGTGPVKACTAEGCECWCRKPGATGEFPEGKLGDDDQGELAINVGMRDGLVVLDFGGTPVTWLAMPPEKAMDVAEMLNGAAVKLMGGKHK